MSGAIRPNDAPGAGDTPERYDLGLCLSGGGYRAMLFHAGALARLNDAGLLPKIDLISSVSGGSIAAGLLAACWRNLDFGTGEIATNFRAKYLDRVLQVAQSFIDAPAFLSGLLNPFSSPANALARAYDRHLFEGRSPTLKSLPDRPWFVFCASNLSTGSLFRMSDRYIADYRIGFAPAADLPLATAVAASSAFPPFLSPLHLDLKPSEWVGEELDNAVGKAVPADRAVLTDGGVYDNHGVETALKRCRWVLVSDAGAPWRASSAGFRGWLGQLKRVVGTTDNQVRALRRRDLVARFKAGEEADRLGLPPGAVMRERAAVRGVYWSIASDPDRYPAPKPFVYERFGPLAPAEVKTALHFLGARETEDIVNWGYYMSDVALRSHFQPTPGAGSALPVPEGTVRPSRSARFSAALMRLLPL